MLNLELQDQNRERTEEYRSLMDSGQEILKMAQQGEACYQDSLGWLHVDDCADETHLQKIEETAASLREKSDCFVLIGVGGSNNAARSVIEALRTEGNPKIVYAGNTLSANAMNRMLKSLEGKHFTIDCIAKNFETLEPGASFRVLRRALREKYGPHYADRVLATGTEGSSLEDLCRKEGYAFLDFPKEVGGRYTAMTNVGLLPMAVAGIDIRALVQGARDMEETLRNRKAEENIAYQYACLRNAYYRLGYRIEMLSSFAPQLRWYYQWWTQLFAESEGKDGKGIFPTTGEFSEQLHSIGQFIQDGTPLLFETFVDVTDPEDSLIIEPDGMPDGFDYLNGRDFRDINRADYLATLGAHSQKLPCNTITIEKIDAYHFGQLFYFNQFACYLSCRIMGVNPFDQPGVEAYKERMFRALGKN